jgi:CheY-like chemotaxis protein
MRELALLLADNHPGSRSLVATLARERIEALAVLEAEDGREAVQIGLEQRPQIALLDVAMPRLGGIEAALTLRELEPTMRLALHTGAPLAHRDRARALGLPLFDKLDLDRALAWLERQVRPSTGAPPWTQGLECATCGYGVARRRPPERCPMCGGEDAWIEAPWRPFTRERVPC